MTGCDSERREAPQANREIADDSSPYALNHAGELKCASHNAFATLHYYLQPVINMTKVMFICHGNICRSPMAEFVMKDLVRKAGLDDAFDIESAATSTEELGNEVYPPARRKLAEHGIGCKGKRARQMTRSDYDHFDLLIGMDQWNIRNMTRICGGDPEGKIRMLMDYTSRPGEVADPWYTGNFEATWRDVLEGCQALLETLR